MTTSAFATEHGNQTRRQHRPRPPGCGSARRRGSQGQSKAPARRTRWLCHLARDRRFRIGLRGSERRALVAVPLSPIADSSRRVIARMPSRRAATAAGVDLIEDVPAFLARPDDLRSGKLLQMARNNRAILGQAGSDRSDVGAAQQDELTQHRNARRLTKRPEEPRVKDRHAPPRGFLSRHRHLASDLHPAPHRGVARIHAFVCIHAYVRGALSNGCRHVGVRRPCWIAMSRAGWCRWRCFCWRQRQLCRLRQTWPDM